MTIQELEDIAHYEETRAHGLFMMAWRDGNDTEAQYWHGNANAWVSVLEAING